MEIQFERTEEDFVEFNLFHISNSPSIKKQILWTRIIMAIMPFVFLFVFYKNISITDYLIATIIALVFVFSYPSIYRSSSKSQTRKFLKEGNNKSLLGHNTIELTPEGILGKSLSGESKINWSSVDKIRQNDEFIFIYIGTINALVIPKHAFSSTAKQKDFIDYINSNTGEKASKEL